MTTLTEADRTLALAGLDAARTFVTNALVASDPAPASDPAAVVDAMGTWTLAPGTGDRRPILLNGTQFGGGLARLLVLDGGSVKSFDGSDWWHVVNGGWALTTAPGATQTPPVQPSSPPDPVVPPTPVVIAGKVAALGSAMQGRRYNDRADVLDLSKALPDVPFNCFADAANDIIAFSQNGVQATDYEKLSVWGQGGNLYAMINIPTPTGTKPWSAHVGDTVSTDNPEWKAQSPHSIEGERGHIVLNAIVSWKGHPTLMPDPTNPGKFIKIPRGPHWIGGRIDGAICALYPRGGSHILGTIAGATALLDIALNEIDRTKFYGCDAKRIVMIDRSIAVADTKKRVDAGEQNVIENGALWSTPAVIYTGTATITGLACMKDGTLYAACADGRILKLIPNGVGLATVTTLITLPVPPFALDPTSKGLLAVLDTGSNVRVIDPANPVPGPQLMSAGNSGTPGSMPFGTISVDINGTFGPVDNIAVTRSHGAHNNDLFILSGPGWSSCVEYGNIPQGNSTRSVGHTLLQTDLAGHYPWTGRHHPDQGQLLVGGFSNCCPSIIRPVQPNSKPIEQWDHNLWNHGISVVAAGTVAGMEGSKPSLTCQHDITGGSMFGAGSDNIVAMSKPDGSADFAAMAKWIQGGGIGAFPRPEIVGYDLKGLLTFHVGQSLRLVNEGQPLLDALNAFIGPVTPTPAPVVYAQTDGDIFGTAAAVGGNLVVTFMDRYGDPPSVMNTAVIVHIVVDEGLPTQLVVGAAMASNNWTLPIPTLASGQHPVSCHITTPTYFGEASVLVV